MRVADIINLLEDEGSDADRGGTAEMRNLLSQTSEASCGSAWASPRRMLLRLIRQLKDRGRQNLWKERAKREKEKEKEKELVGQSRNVRCSLVEAGYDRGEKSSLVGTSSSGIEECGEVAMPSMGAACDLLYLIAASKDELSKLRELRLEIQLLLHNAKEESQREDSGCEKEESEESISSCLTNLEEAPSCSNVTSSRSSTFPYLITREQNAIMSVEECPESMEQLEAELEAELELLQLQLDVESSSESTKVSVNNFAASEEVVNTREAPPEIYDGVPPVELERRLHQLLESQQQEKIKELESAVECLKTKLSDKEREVLQWKGTALQVSQNILSYE